VRSTLVRWMAPLGAGFLFLLVLMIFLVLRMHYAEAGLTVMLGKTFFVRPVKLFALRFTLTLLLPFYLASALVLCGLALTWGSAFRKQFSQDWRALEGLGLTLSALLWVHVFLWWQVPSTLWLLGGLRSLPFWASFPLLTGAALAYPIHWIRKQRLGWLRGAAVVGGWLLLWSLVPYAPRVLPRLLSPARGGDQEAKVLVIGLDGLRQDVGEQATTRWTGTLYPNAYTVIPATRLLWHILWGGDPLYYTVGHAPPALEEYNGEQTLPLVDEADAKGWKPRFYIDDGGTIGLIGRRLNFDDMLMPAPGWENFINSNLSASFPLFAAWENWGRAFPTTNPWAPLDAGLKEALRLGRGSKWVMFHSCLAHQPIFLHLEELARLPHWWTLAPATLEPFTVRMQVTPQRAAHYDPRRDPFQAYTIRMESILKAWEPIWNGLAQDPMYRNATRILFSDHGERFYHVTDAVRLGGVHGYNLDPWETRVMLRVAGPGFALGTGIRKPDTLSLLSLRDGFRYALDHDGSIPPPVLEQAWPVAPMRYHSLDLDLFQADATEYRQLDLKELANGTAIAPEGLWFTRYQATVEARAEDVSLAWGRGEDLEVVRPLKGPGAYRYNYKGYTLQKVTAMTEDEYKAEKAKVKRALSGGR